MSCACSAAPEVLIPSLFTTYNEHVDTLGTAENVLISEVSSFLTSGVVLYTSLYSWDPGQCLDLIVSWCLLKLGSRCVHVAFTC